MLLYILASLLVLQGLLLIFLGHGVQIVGMLLVFYGALLFFGAVHGKDDRSTRLRRIISWILGIAAAAGILLLDIPILRGAKSDAQPDADYLVILGAAVYGTEPSPALRDRLDWAILYLEESPDTIAVVSGGQGPDEGISEAQAMKNYLVAHGISEERILMEDQSTSTKENLLYSFSIIEKHYPLQQKNGSQDTDHRSETTTENNNSADSTDSGIGTTIEDGTTSDANPTIVVISSEYHLFRIRYLAKKLGHPVTCLAAPTSFWLGKVNYFIREIPAMAKAILID